MTKVLVTGATGFLGSHTLKALMARPGIKVIAACRRPEKLPREFKGEIRQGDLQDTGYRLAVLKDVDVVCNAASWASLWNHKDLERERFFKPTQAFIEQALKQGVKRFIQASTIAITTPSRNGEPLDDFAPTVRTGFWPHLDLLIDIDDYMRAHADQGMQMVTLRFGHFVGPGNVLGLLPVLVPRMKTHLVPWLAGGRKQMPLTADTDLGEGFARAVLADGLNGYESFNLCGSEFPAMREVIQFISKETGFPAPHYSVPYPVGYAFGWLMEKLAPLLSGVPFLTRSIVHLSENWVASNQYARDKLGYTSKKDWRTAIREHLSELKQKNYPWPRLVQPV